MSPLTHKKKSSDMDRVRLRLSGISSPEADSRAARRKILEDLASELKFPGCRIDGIVIHWSAGAYGLNSQEEGAYHFVVQPDGRVQRGQFTLAQQTPPLVFNPRSYAAHTKGFNSYRAGVSMDAMGGAVERPFNPGRWPVTEEQVSRTCELCAAILKFYGLELSRNTVNTHAEVPIVHGRPQPGKWDVNWLPWMRAPVAPLVAGDILREQIKEFMS